MNSNLMTLPADLPENWQNNQIIAPSGREVGLSDQHGFNYLMKAVNDAHKACNRLKEDNEKLREESANKVNLDGSTPIAGDQLMENVIIDNATGVQAVRFQRNGIQTGKVYCSTFYEAIVVDIHRSDGSIKSYHFTANSFDPVDDNFVDLGANIRKFRDAYLQNPPIVTSDQRIKKDILPLEIGLVTKLLMSIAPVQYRLKDGNSGRLHYGFIAQDVEAALTEAELTSMDFAGFIKSPVLDENGNETGDDIYALRLEEFIPILWAHQQDLERRMQAVEAR